jgi:hypothetical protein
MLILVIVMLKQLITQMSQKEMQMSLQPQIPQTHQWERCLDNSNKHQIKTNTNKNKKLFKKIRKPNRIWLKQQNYQEIKME